jgi:hypothetical protein
MKNSFTLANLTSHQTDELDAIIWQTACFEARMLQVMRENSSEEAASVFGIQPADLESIPMDADHLKTEILNAKTELANCFCEVFKVPSVLIDPASNDLDVVGSRSRVLRVNKEDVVLLLLNYQRFNGIPSSCNGQHQHFLNLFDLRGIPAALLMENCEPEDDTNFTSNLSLFLACNQRLSWDERELHIGMLVSGMSYVHHLQRELRQRSTSAAKKLWFNHR